MHLRIAVIVIFTVSLAVSACGRDTGGSRPDGGCADVESVEVSETGPRTYRFDVTVHSADTGWDKYADAWEVRDPRGAVLGTRELLHPHVDEQPFTRSLAGVEIPPSVSQVEVAARDSVTGFCGETIVVTIP
jgi:hypothetical protein